MRRFKFVFLAGYSLVLVILGLVVGVILTSSLNDENVGLLIASTATLVGVFLGWFLGELGKTGRIKHYVKKLQVIPRPPNSENARWGSTIIVDLELYNSSELGNIIRDTKISLKSFGKKTLSEETNSLRRENFASRGIKAFQCQAFISDLFIENSDVKKVFNFNRVTLDFMDGNEKKYCILLGRYELVKK